MDSDATMLDSIDGRPLALEAAAYSEEPVNY